MRDSSTPSAGKAALPPDKFASTSMLVLPFSATTLPPSEAKRLMVLAAGAFTRVSVSVSLSPILQFGGRFPSGSVSVRTTFSAAVPPRGVTSKTACVSPSLSTTSGPAPMTVPVASEFSRKRLMSLGKDVEGVAEIFALTTAVS